MIERRVATALGWFGIGLGLVELFAAERVSRAFGLSRRVNLVRLFGVREIATGIGLLLQHRRRGRRAWMWGRVAGDLLDLGLLGSAVVGRNARKLAAAIALGNVAAVSAADTWCAARLSSNSRPKA